MWVQTPYIKPLPPVPRRMPGRPSIKRRRHIFENEDKYSRVSSKGRSVKCKNCLEIGHNMRSCKKPKVNPEPKPKKKMGRPRLNPELTHWTTSGRGIRGGGRGTRGGRAGRGGRGGRNVPQSVPLFDLNVPVVDASVPHNAQTAHESVPQNEPVAVADEYVPQNEPVVDENVPQNEAVVDENVSQNEAMADEAESVAGNEIGDSDTELDIVATISDLRQAKYTDEDIMQCLGLDEAEFQQFAVDVTVEPVHVTQVAESQTIVDTQVPESQALPDPFEEYFTEDEGMDDTQEVKKARPKPKKITPKRRRPSERITKGNLHKVVLDKDGMGINADNALILD